MQRVLAVPMSVVVLLASCGPTPTDTTTPADERQLQAMTAAAPSVNPVVQWNRILLQIVRTPGVQPATVHPTRSFAILHAAIYDAVNSIDRTYTPYVVRLRGAGEPRSASQDAAAAAAAHDVLVALYPSLRAARYATTALVGAGSGRRTQDRWCPHRTDCRREHTGSAEQ